mmetsp:Transcript_8535/g.17170  ORF Transcript_8535/g.17170 Transcript_8535/m.17170 type:complete len:226 (-) Transcript_8535:250-927(-)
MLALGMAAAAFLPIARHRPPHPQLRGVWRITCGVPDSSDAALDELIRREVEAAFKDIDIELSEGDTRELDELVAEKGDAVMRSVLRKLESDGEQLAAALEEQVAAYTKEQQIEMLRKFDEDAAKLQAELQVDRQAIRGDLTRLVSLQKELDSLQAEKGGDINKDSIIGGISFIAGTLYLGNAVNEGLRLAFGDSDGSVASFAINGGLALLGIGYYFYKKSLADSA